MKIDLTNCKTPEDVERAMKPLGELMTGLHARVAEAFATEGTTVIDGGVASGRSGDVTASLKVGKITVHVGEAKPRRWRALVLVVKAKLEAVASGISTLESEFLANIVMGNGQTIGAAMLHRLPEVVSSGRLLPASSEVSQ